MSAVSWSGMDPGLAMMVRLNIDCVTVPFSRSTRTGSPSGDGHLDLDVGIAVDEDEVDVGDGALHRAALELLHDGEVLLAVHREVDEGVEAGVGRQHVAQLPPVDGHGLGIGPRPYTTPGILLSARRRLDERLPVGRPVSAVRVSSAI